MRIKSLITALLVLSTNNISAEPITGAFGIEIGQTDDLVRSQHNVTESLNPSTGSLERKLKVDGYDITYKVLPRNRLVYDISILKPFYYRPSKPPKSSSKRPMEDMKAVFAISEKRCQEELDVLIDHLSKKHRAYQARGTNLFYDRFTKVSLSVGDCSVSLPLLNSYGSETWLSLRYNSYSLEKEHNNRVKEYDPVDPKNEKDLLKNKIQKNF